MDETTNRVRADFDRLAQFSDDSAWGHNHHYHDFLLRHLPPRCGETCEIGCGTGAFARRLAERSERVLALDLSPEMIRLARERSAQFPNIEFRAADVMTDELPAGKFDAIASIATLHHLPLDAMLRKMKTALKPGGVLLILDLFTAASPADWLIAAAGMPVDLALNLIHTGRLRPTSSAEAKAAWEQHGQYDHYLTPAQVKAACRDILPGAKVTRHLLWRYSLIWKKG